MVNPLISHFVVLVCSCWRRLFGTKCDKCGLSFSKTDFVMRAKTKIYHIECFRCSACERHLIPGDEFALREDGLFCKEDHEVLEKATNRENNNNTTNVNNNNSSHNNNNEGSNSGRKLSHMRQLLSVCQCRIFLINILTKCVHLNRKVKYETV